MENKVNRHAPLDRDKWRDIVAAWNKDSETQQAYCQRLGLNIHTFSYVRNKLLEKSKAKMPFIPVTIKQTGIEKALPVSSVILENPRGYKLHLPGSLSPDQFAQLFKLSGWQDA